jgi:hypothetical protein
LAPVLGIRHIFCDAPTPHYPVLVSRLCTYTMWWGNYIFRRAFCKDGSFEPLELVKKDHSINTEFLDKIVPLKIGSFAKQKAGSTVPPQWVTAKDDDKKRLVACGPVAPAV